MQVYKHEVKILHWIDSQELEQQMNTMLNEDDGCKWRAENHYLSGVSSKGWTLYKRSWVENPPLLEAKVRASAVFDAVNSSDFYNMCSGNDKLIWDIGHFITDKIKEALKKEQ